MSSKEETHKELEVRAIQTAICEIRCVCQLGNFLSYQPTKNGTICRKMAENIHTVLGREVT